MPIILNNISKAYSEKNIFDNFSFDFEEGNIYAIIGDSGTGKTTLLNIIGLLEKSDKGEVVINGNNHWNRKSIKKLYKNELSFLFQNYALIDYYTVEENLKMILDKNSFSKIDNILEQLNIIELKSKKIYTLSGGQQQRVALARALLHDTKIMLCDEPTGNLDHNNKEIIFNILRKWITQDKLIIMVTHDNELAKQCDVIIDLNAL